MIFKHLSVENLNEKVTMNFFEFNTNGLNIILGQKSPENDETNGVGKTALVETIRYCLGSSLPNSFSGKQKLKQNSLCAVLLLRIGNLEMRIARLYYDSSLVFVTSNPSVDNYSLSKWDTYKEDEYRKFIERLIYAALPNDASFGIPSFQAVREYLIRDEKNGFSDITLAQRNAVQNHQILAFLSLLPNNIESMISNQKGIIKNLQDELKIVNAIGKEIKDIKSSYDNTLLDIQLLQKQLTQIAYNESGYLAYQFINDQKINASTGRIKIQCSIDDEGAHGRYLMKINMFDIALLLNRIDSGNILPFLVHDGSYSKPAPAVKGNVLMHVDEYLKKQGRGQYFVTINIEELLENDVNIMRNNGMVVAELERDENDGKRFIGIKY